MTTSEKERKKCGFSVGIPRPEKGGGGADLVGYITFLTHSLTLSLRDHLCPRFVMHKKLNGTHTHTHTITNQPNQTQPMRSYGIVVLWVGIWQLGGGEEVAGI